MDTIDRDIELIVSDLLSEKAQLAAVREFALATLAEAQAGNAEALGAAPEVEIYIDETLVNSLDGLARLSSVITFEFDIITALATWIEYQLIEHSPVRTGRYQKSHRLFADGGGEIEIADIPLDVKELVFAPLAPYARLIEPHGGQPGESRQAPDGVYQSIAALAGARFPGIGIAFGWREIAGIEESEPERIARPNAPRDLRQPAIIVTF